MTREQFVKIMIRFHDSWESNEKFFDQLENIFGVESVIACIEHSYFELVIKMLDMIVDPRIKDIEYLIHECGFDLQDYSQGVSKDINDYGEMYDYIIDQERGV